MPYAKKEKSGKDAYDKGDLKAGTKQRRSRKKVCPFCADKAESIDYKEIAKVEEIRFGKGKNPSQKNFRLLCKAPETAYDCDQKSQTRCADAFLGRLIQRVENGAAFPERKHHFAFRRWYEKKIYRKIEYDGY